MAKPSLNLPWGVLKSRVCPYFSAGLLVLSFPNFNFSFLIWIGLIPLLFFFDEKKPWGAFLWGWLTGYLFFLGTHYWLIHVTLPGMLLVNLYLGIYFGLFGLGYVFFKNFPLKYKIWLLPSLWVVLEFTRDRLFTGFGWVCLGHSQYQVLPIIQIADITGVFGVSFLIVMVNVLIKDFIENRKVGSVPTFLVVGGVLVYGMVQLAQYSIVSGRNDQRITVIQPNIAQSRKWDPSSWPGIQKKILKLTELALEEKPDVLVWPETSFPGFTWQSPERYEDIKNFVARNRVPLLLGTVTVRNGNYYNSAILLSEKGQEVSRYDKMHLVPFGEFLPLRPLLNFIENFVPIEDFGRGKELKVFPQGFSVAICFEDTVAPVVRALTMAGAGYLINITNDGWFKDTNEPFLHLQASIFQAVANRRAIVRAANTGVSGFIDANGAVSVFKAKDGRSVMREGLFTGPIAPNLRISFYTRFGDVFAYLCFLIVAVALIKRRNLL